MEDLVRSIPKHGEVMDKLLHARNAMQSKLFELKDEPWILVEKGEAVEQSIMEATSLVDSADQVLQDLSDCSDDQKACLQEKLEVSSLRHKLEEKITVGLDKSTLATTSYLQQLKDFSAENPETTLRYGVKELSDAARAIVD